MKSLWNKLMCWLFKHEYQFKNGELNPYCIRCGKDIRTLMTEDEK